MLVGRRLSREPAVRSLKRGPGWRVLDRAAGSLLDPIGLQYVFYPSSFALRTDPWLAWSDVVQLHNLHGSYFAFTALPGLTRRRPVFWLLQDQWATTGHVAYSLDCERWRHGCGACPYLAEYPRLPRDTTRLLWRLKERVYARSRLTLVVPSRWMEANVKASPLLGRFPVHRIPHGVDTEVFSPGSREAARERLGLPADRPIVFFSASDLWERRKGLHLLERALALLDAPPLLLLAGTGAPPAGLAVHSLGSVEDDATLADAYRAADVYAVPTLADVLTQTAPESLACGTPCISFDRGGVTDVVRHRETGYHAAFGSPEALAEGLRALLGDPQLRARLGARGRELALDEFSATVQVRRYVDLYESAR
jgi:glycosyltransferase involved in cell wall biosynthesis